jgi:hypothetical protein
MWPTLRAEGLEKNLLVDASRQQTLEAVLSEVTFLIELIDRTDLEPERKTEPDFDLPASLEQLFESFDVEPVMQEQKSLPEQIDSTPLTQKNNLVLRLEYAPAVPIDSRAGHAEVEEDKAAGAIAALVKVCRIMCMFL